MKKLTLDLGHQKVIAYDVTYFGTWMSKGIVTNFHLVPISNTQLMSITMVFWTNLQFVCANSCYRHWFLNSMNGKMEFMLFWSCLHKIRTWMFSHGDNKPNFNNIFLNRIQMGANTIKEAIRCENSVFK